MNPFTRAILYRKKDRRMSDFVQHWDSLEALVIRVYKAGGASPQDEREFQQAHAWLEKHYLRWQAGLQPYWQATRIGGEPASEDPFASLIARQRAQDFAGDWRAMQNLPAAREALNEFLINPG